MRQTELLKQNQRVAGCRWVAIVALSSLVTLVVSHVTYEFDGDFDANGITLDIDNTANLCLCDLTTAGCDLNCQCDPDCPSNTDTFRADYGFDFVGSSVDITSQCYSTDNVKLFKVNSKPSMLATDGATSGFVCIDASSPTQSGEKVGLASFNESYALSVEQVLQSKNATSLISSYTSSLTLTSSVLGYKYNDPLRFLYTGTNAIYLTIARNGGNCNPTTVPEKFPMIPRFGATTTYSCYFSPAQNSCTAAFLRLFDVYRNFLGLTVAKTNQTIGASFLSFEELSVSASVSGTTCTVSEGLKYTVMYHYDSQSLGFVIDAVVGQTLPSVSVNMANGEGMYFKTQVEFLDLDTKSYWTKSSSTPAIIPKDIAAVLESLFSVDV